MNEAQAPIGVLLMAYGGPSSLEEVEPYLLDVRGGRSSPPELLEKVRRCYAHIGGRSPLTEITIAAARSLEVRLNREGARYQVYVGMRHWHPYIKQAVEQMAKDGVRRLVGLCMAPHYSTMSTSAYFAKLSQAQDDLGTLLEVAPVSYWFDHPKLLQSQLLRIEQALNRFEPAEQDSVQVIFSAHSLPARILRQGDPYDQQLRASARQLAAALRLPADRWRFCYQSAARSSEPWLGPPLEEVVCGLAETGHKHLLVSPIGFVADHMEVLYGIDVTCRTLAAKRGARLERTESLNASEDFVAALDDIVRMRVEELWSMS